MTNKNANCTRKKCSHRLIHKQLCNLTAHPYPTNGKMNSKREGGVGVCINNRRYVT
jgi:hypothetical protein